MRSFLRSVVAVAGVACAASASLQGQSAAPPMWLRYAIPPDPPRYHDMPHAVVLLGDAPEEKSAADELDLGLGHMVAGTDTLVHRFDPRLDAIVLGTSDALRRVRPRLLVKAGEAPLPEDAYRIRHVRKDERQWWVLEGGSPRAELYAAFRFSALVAEDRQLPDTLTETARIPLRALDLEGDLGDPRPVALKAMARLMASVGLNGLLVDAGGVTDAQQLVAAMRPFGIRVWFRGMPAETAVAAAASGVVLTASDPKRFAADVAKADAAARLLRRHGATVVLEGTLADTWPASAPLAELASLRSLEPNVLLLNAAVPSQLPLAGLASSVFGLLQAPQGAAVPLFPMGTQSVVYPAAVWESALATPERGVRDDGTLADTLSRRGGIVAHLTMAEWTEMLQQPLLQANLFAFGRVAWNPAEKPDDMADAWARQTFGDDARAFGVAKTIELKSAEAFAQVSSPFGLPWLGDGRHPDPEREAHRIARATLAGHDALGVDRSADLAGYPPAFAAELVDASRTPERWLLALHRVPPTLRLANGKTVVQAFYDAHFAGAAQMSNALDDWETTQGLVDPQRYKLVHDQLALAARRGEVWRDGVTEWMERATGVPDELRFVGNHPGRVEAETLTLHGCSQRMAMAPGDASGGGYVACGAKPGAADAQGSVEMVFHGEANVYRVETGYYGAAAGGTLELQVNGAAQGRWTVEQDAGSPSLPTSERYVVNGVRLKPGDRLTLAGDAALDFIDITRDPRWN